MTLTDQARQALFAEETEEVFLLLITIDHAQLSEPIRIANDFSHHWSRGGSNAIDRGPFGNHGARTGGVWTDGYFDGGLKQQNDGDIVSVGDVSELKGLTEFNIELVVEPSDISVSRCLVRCGTGNDVDYAIYHDNIGKLVYYWFDGVVVQTQATLVPVIAAGIWNKISITRSADKQTVKTYIDGVLVDTMSVTASQGAGGVFTIGGSGVSPTESFRGIIDDVRVWNRERTIEEIVATKDDQIVGNEPDVLGYWSMDDGDMFVGAPIRPILPSITDGQAPVAQLEIDNVDREIVRSIRTITSSPSVTMEVVMASTPEVVEAEFSGFLFKDIRYDLMRVTGSLELENLVNEPYPSGTFTPGQFPALF